MTETQTAGDVLMIRPVRFAGNVETAASNRFQQLGEAGGAAAVQAAALREFEVLSGALQAAGIRVHLFDDTLEPHTPDSLFPNNWVSFHADGTVVLYPMLARNRRLERRMDILETLGASGFHIGRIVDLTPFEREGKFLEGTGSLVLDRVHRIAYACLSPRTDPEVLAEFARQLEYEPLLFRAADASGSPVYHTNVMMCVGTRFAAVCTAALGEADRKAVLGRLQACGHEILELTLAQMTRFAGNMLELRHDGGRPRLALSASAYDSLTASQLARLAALDLSPVTAALPTIERLGGGSVRCMLGEICLPRGVSSEP